MATIQKLRAYFGNAIREMGNRKAKTAKIANMKIVTLASLCHSVMVQKPSERHRYCPLEETSWCRYRKIKQIKDKSHHLDAVFLPLLTKIYRRLSSPTLLRRCLGNYTQHQNESFNSLVWVRAPKHKFHSKARLQLAVIGAVLTFNGGDANWDLILHVLGITTPRISSQRRI